MVSITLPHKCAAAMLSQKSDSGAGDGSNLSNALRRLLHTPVAVPRPKLECWVLLPPFLDIGDEVRPMRFVTER